MQATPPPAGAAPSFGYIPALDGLRAVAVLLVLVAHFGFSRWVPGGLGVTLFFFISGMLITRLLLAEREKNGRIAVGRFYLRRMLRLYPALLLAVAAGTAATLAAGGPLLWGKIAAALLYGINYYGVAHGWSEGMRVFDPMGVLWSLAIEEQYYIVFPLLALALAGNTRAFGRWVAAAVLAVLAWRILLHLGGASSDRIYLATDTRIDAILYGCLLTLLMATSPEVAARWLCRLSRRWVLALALASLLASLLIRAPLFRETLRYSVQSLALVPLVAALCFTASVPKATGWLEHPALRLVGRLSYSLYLLHAVAITVGEMVFGPASQGWGLVGWPRYLGFVALVVPLSMLLAWASYQWVEMPFVRLRRRFGSHPVEARER